MRNLRSKASAGGTPTRGKYKTRNVHVYNYQVLIPHGNPALQSNRMGRACTDQTNTRANGMPPERRSNLCENILADYLYTYLHWTLLSFSSVLER